MQNNALTKAQGSNRRILRFWRGRSTKRLFCTSGDSGLNLQEIRSLDQPRDLPNKDDERGQVGHYGSLGLSRS